MGNCQAVDTAAMVIQHPCGKEKKFYSTVSAREVMKDNPGYHIALLITTTTTTAAAADGGADSGGHGHLRITRVKILRPDDTLLLGRVYRLISHQEVVKGLTERRRSGVKERKGEMAKDEEDEKKKKTKGVRVRGRGWRPSLGSIDEGIGL